MTTTTTTTPPVHPMLKTIREIVAAAGQTAAFETADEFHLSIENAPFMRLVIEAHPAMDTLGYSNARRTITVSHYAEKDRPTDDPMVDTDLEMLDNGAMVNLTFAYGHGFQRVYFRDDHDRVLVAPRAKREVESFARTWARNLKAQGFVKAAKAQAAK